MKMGNLFIIGGMLLLLVGVYLKYNESKKGDDLSVSNERKKDNSMAKDKEKNNEYVVEDEKLTENEKKGQKFEGWVVDHFNKKYFKLKEWRGDKIQKGTYAESNRYPDMEWEFSLHGEKYYFAVECKYRSSKDRESITWASEENVEIYNKYANEKGIPVFVVIGLGGTPESPEEVYCVPLAKLSKNWVRRSFLQHFMKNTEANFYYDTETRILR